MIGVFKIFGSIFCHSKKKKGNIRNDTWTINKGNRTEWSPVWSVIIRVINQIGRPRSRSPIC